MLGFSSTCSRRSIRALSGPLSIALCAFAMLAAQEGTAHADQKKADALFDAGVKLFKAGKVAEAKVKFEASYAEEPAPRALFNIALAEEELKQFAAARARFRAYTRLPDSSKLTAEQREKANRHVVSLESKVCTLQLVVPASASFTVDGKGVRGDVADLEAGNHSVEVVGAEPASSQIACVAGETKRFEASIKPVAKDKGPDLNPDGVAADTKPAGDTYRSAAGYVVPTFLIVAGAAGAGAGFLFAGASNRAKDDVQAFAGTGVCRDRQSAGCLSYEARRDDQGKNDTYSKIAYIGGGALALVGVISLIAWPSSRRSTTERQVPERQVSVTAELGGVRVFGTF